MVLWTGWGRPQGAEVTASDISSSMAQEAERRYKAAAAQPGAAAPTATPKFVASDLESQGGRFHTVACLDVMIHYPQVRTLHCRRHSSCSAPVTYSHTFNLGSQRSHAAASLDESIAHVNEGNFCVFR